MKLIITGTPGTGKSAVARILGQRLGIPVITVKDLVRGEYIDTRKLRMKALWTLRKMDKAILEGHLFCEVKLPVDTVIVLRTDPEVLKRRLEPRNYPEKKVKENLMAEFLDYCLVRAASKYPQEKIWQIDTTHRTAEETAELIEKALRGGKRIYEEVDWSNKLEEWIRKGYIS